VTARLTRSIIERYNLLDNFSVWDTIYRKIIIPTGIRGSKDSFMTEKDKP
jgi:hypothetical protein